MLTSARKSMPAIDYVSIVRSLYGDARALLFGTFTCAVTAGASAWKTGSVWLGLVALAFLLVGAGRYANMRAFMCAGVGPEDSEAAERWENRALIGGSLIALTHGIWCMVSLLLVRDSFTELAAISLSIAGTVGIVARNFGLDRLVTIQTLLVGLPLALALFLRSEYHVLLAVLLVIMLFSHRKLAGDIRAILLAAVHGRVEATSLAAERDIALTTMNHGMIMLDETGAVTVVNETAREIFRRLDTEIGPRRAMEELLEVLSQGAQVPDAAITRLTELVNARGAGKVLVCLPDNSYYEVTVSSRRERSVLLFEDITERVATEQRISHMARYDALTGLANRSYFAELVNDDLARRRAAALEGNPIRQSALLLIDIDDFKHVNDTMGHMVGDRLLRETARRLGKVLASHCTLARLGGDEFVVYAADLASPEMAEHLSGVVQSVFTEPFDLGSVAPLVGASIGIVVSTQLADDLEGLLAKADLALYAAKAGGKHGSQLFHADMDISYQYRQRLKFDLSEAVARGALSLAFQPLIDIGTGRVVGCEALARWTHPSLGVIPPSIFIPLAEEMGLINAITAWVLRQAALECMRWPDSISVAVNVSARDFRTGNIGRMVSEALGKSGLPAHRLGIEVTETVLIDQRDMAIDVLRDLADQGVAIALDDFGTGYSSLSYLQALPFTKLKIDSSFLVNIESDDRALKLLANVARLGSELDMCVIAEGVETQAQLELIRTHTPVSQVQGYLFSRPLPARDIAELIARFDASPVSADETRKRG